MNSNICEGDSGGPLMYFLGNKWYIYGVGSYVLTNDKGRCATKAPSYFSQVPKFLGWINSTIASFAK